MECKIPISFIGVGFVGGQWVDYLMEKRGYVRGTDLFCYDPPKVMIDDVNKARIVVICVPTPANKDGSCDLSILHKSISLINDNERRWVVIRSTVPPGTTACLEKKYPGKAGFVFIPEFLTEARAKENFRNPDRIIIAPAGRNFQIVDTLLDLLPKALGLQIPGYLNAYERFDATSTEAELTKYFGNIMGATKVILAEIFSASSKLVQNMLAHKGIDTRVDYNGHVRKMTAADYRIGDSHLQSGHGGYNGFGGYCFIKDTYAFMSFLFELLAFYSKREGVDVELLNLIKNMAIFFQSMLELNKTFLSIHSLTEDEVIKHTGELERLIIAKKESGLWKELEDYLPKMDKTNQAIKDINHCD